MGARFRWSSRFKLEPLVEKRLQLARRGATTLNRNDWDTSTAGTLAAQTGAIGLATSSL